MPQLLPGETRQRERGKVHKELVDKIASSEEEGLGTLPTALVYSGALAASDDKEAARWAVLLARQLDLPTPPAQPGKRAIPRQRTPKQLIDPYTGKPISVTRAKSLLSLGDHLASVLTADPRRGGRPDPAAVASYLSATELVGDVPAEYALGLALDMERKGTPLERFRGNLSVIEGWNKDTGTISDEESLIYARWWAENKERPITIQDLVTLTTPELTAAIEEKQHSGSIRLGINVNADDIDRLVSARERAIANPSYLKDAQRILQEIEAPTWADRSTSWAAAQLNDLWHVSEHLLVDVSTIPVGAIDLVQGALPGGQTVGDAFRETQRERQYLIQRINAGDSIGHIYAEDSFLPEWAAPAFDFAVGWVFDPTILGGKLLQGFRAGRLVPELLEGGRLARAFTPTGVKDWFARIQYENFGGSVLKFSRSKSSRELFESMYKGEGDMFRTIDRLATHVEARSALEFEYMGIARAQLLAKYPQASEKAWAEWQNIMRSHFGLKPPPGSVAESVVAARQGVSEAATQPAIRAVSTGEGLVISASRATDDVVREATTPLALRAEVPHRLLPVPGLGGVKLGRLRFAESTLGQTDFGSNVRSILNVNPGAVLRPGHNPEQFFARKAVRWRTFTEPEIREFQARAIEIANSGNAIERRMGALLEEMDRTAMRRIARQMDIPEEAIGDAIDTWTARVRGVNEQAVFGVAEKTARGGRLATKPLTETQLIDEIVSLDPVQIRKFLKRYNSTFSELSRSMKDHGLPDVASAAFRASDTSRDFARAAMRTWKFTVVPRPAYIGRVILLDENLRFLTTTHSLLERFTSLELKKGVRGLVGRAINKPLRETIKVGDDVIEIGRAGTFGYEPLANQAFHTEEALDDILRRAGTHEKALKTLGHYGIVNPSDSQHLAVWMRSLNFQLGNSIPGRIALQSVRDGEALEGTVARLKSWAKGDGYVTLRSRVGVPASDVDEWARDLAGMTHGYTMGNRELADAAITRSIAEDMLSAVPIANRPVVHGPLVEALTGAAGSNNPLKRVVNGVYNAFVRAPENVLNRQPYYRVWKRRAERAQYRALEAQGTTLTPEIKAAVDASSRDFALAQVKKIMFDFTENTRLGEMISSVVPFFQPWAEAYQVWGHILVHRNPAMIGYVRNVWKLAEETGVVQKDEEGRWTMPWSLWQRATSLLPWVGGDKLPEGLGLVAPLSSFNLFLSSSVEVGGFPIPAPSLAPWAAVPLKAFFAETENPYLTSYLFSYGPDTPLVSSWLEKAVRAIKPDAFNDNRDQAVALDFLRLYQYLGTDVDENGKPLPPDVLKERALADARRVNAMYATIGFIAPTRGQLTFPEGYENKERELDQLRDVLGFEEGTDRFLSKYPELTLMTIGKTVDTRQLDGETAPRLPQSEDVQSLYRQPAFARFAKRFPAWTALLVLNQDEQWDESSLGVFSDQIHAGAIKYKGLDRFLTEGQIPGFWNSVDAMYSWYNPAADRFEAQGLGDDNERVLELKRRKAEELYDIYLRFPQYAKKQGIRPDPNNEGQAIWDGDAGTPPSTLVVSQARAITELEGFQSFPGVQGLKAYLDLRDEIADQMARAGIANIDDTTAQRLGATAVTHTVLTSHPTDIGQAGGEGRPVRINIGLAEAAPYVSAAVKRWNELLGFEALVLVDTPEGADFSVRSADEWEGKPPLHGRTGGWVSGDVFLRFDGIPDDEEGNPIRPEKTTYFRTLLHELGHTLGLPDTYDAEGPKREKGIGASSFNKPSQGELDKIKELFGLEPVTTQEGGLTDKWETGKAAIIEKFPEVEPFINAFFDDDLEGVPSKAERRLVALQKKDPTKYQSYANTETHLENLADATVVANTSDDRDLAYAELNDYIDTLYETDEDWKLRLWFDSKSASNREVYLESLQVRPPAFYSRFDWELAGVKLTDRAAGWLADIDAVRAQIEAANQAELRGGKEFTSGDAYESLDKAVAARIGQDKTFATAINAMRTWGWGLWNSDLVDQKGKAGYAWRTIRDLTGGINDAAIRIGLHGPDSFDSDDYKEAYVRARDALLDRINEFRKWSPAFDDQITDIQRTQLRGDPFVEWLMPDSYYPIGVTGD